MNTVRCVLTSKIVTSTTASSWRSTSAFTRRAEILVDDLSDAAEQIVAGRGAEIERLADGRPCRARIVFDAARKREMAELLWSLGCEVSSMNPLKTSLEGLFLKLVSDYEEQK